VKEEDKMPLPLEHKGLTEDFKSYLMFSVVATFMVYTSLALVITINGIFIIGVVFWPFYLGWSSIFEQTTQFLDNP